MGKLEGSRDGDTVTARGTVRNGAIDWHRDSIKIERPRLKVGDTVAWSNRDAVEPSQGEVLAIDASEADGTVYVWIRERGKWPRVTRAASDLRRVSEA